MAGWNPPVGGLDAAPPASADNAVSASEPQVSDPGRAGGRTQWLGLEPQRPRRQSITVADLAFLEALHHSDLEMNLNIEHDSGRLLGRRRPIVLPRAQQRVRDSRSVEKELVCRLPEGLNFAVRVNRHSAACGYP